MPPSLVRWLAQSPSGLPAGGGRPNMFCCSTDSQRPSFVTRCFFVSSCGLLPPFVPPGGGRSAVAFLPQPCALAALRGVGCKVQAPLKGGQRYFIFYTGVCPLSLRRGAATLLTSHPPSLRRGVAFKVFFIFYRLAPPSAHPLEIEKLAILYRNFPISRVYEKFAGFITGAHAARTPLSSPCDVVTTWMPVGRFHTGLGLRPSMPNGRGAAAPQTPCLHPPTTQWQLYFPKCR